MNTVKEEFGLDPDKFSNDFEVESMRVGERVIIFSFGSYTHAPKTPCPAYVVNNYGFYLEVQVGEDLDSPVYEVYSYEFGRPAGDAMFFKNEDPAIWRFQEKDNVRINHHSVVSQIEIVIMAEEPVKEGVLRRVRRSTWLTYGEYVKLTKLMIGYPDFLSEEILPKSGRKGKDRA
jgi:hypothetical protein